MLPFKIEGKVALVTGAASGIGLCVARELLRNKAKGVAIVDYNTKNGQKVCEELQRKFGESACIFIHCDVSQFKEVEEAFETTVKVFKQLDIVVNNAGVGDEEDWQKCVSINLMGTLVGTNLALQKYLPRHKSTQQAVIVNMASITGIQPFHLYPVYSTTKYGIVGLSRAYGAPERFEQTNIKVIAICPGFTNTPLISETDFVKNAQKPEYVAQCLLAAIRDAPSGTVWIVNNGQPAYEETFSDHPDFY